MDEYTTLSKSGVCELLIEKSRFIGYAAYVANEEDAAALIDKIKKEHYNATHNCFAFVGAPDKGLFRCSDDGEPQGTAGLPILEVLKGEEIYNALIVVTRYFGVVKLGAGGLLRAYSRCAKEALNTAEKSLRTMAQVYDITLGYELYKLFERFVKTENLTVLNVDYGVSVTANFVVEKKISGEVIKKLINYLGGKAMPIIKEDKYFSFNKRRG